MRRILLALFCVMLCVSPALCDVALDEAHFPDPIFREWLKSYDTFGGYDEYGKTKWGADYANGVLSDFEIQRITSFSRYYDENPEMRISSLEGIKYLTSLNSICVQHQDITELDISGMKNLKRLEFVGSVALSCSVNAGGCTSLDYAKISCGGGSVEKVNFSECSALREIELLTINEINLSGCTGLKSFRSTYGVNKIDFSECVSLDRVQIIHAKELTSLNLSGLENLKSVSVYGCSNLVSMDLNGCASLETLSCYYSSYRTFYTNPLLEKVNLRGCKNLRYFASPSSNLKSIDLTHCWKLEELKLDRNKLTSLNVRRNEILKKIDVYGNKLTYLDLDNNKVLENVSAGNQEPEAINAIPYGKRWKINLTDYMPEEQIKNIDPDSIKASSSYYYGYGKCTVSFDVKNCAVIVDTPSVLPPSMLEYEYNTHSPVKTAMTVSIYQRKTFPKVYRANGSIAYNTVIDINENGYLCANGEYLTESYNFGYYHTGYAPAENANGFTADGNSRLFLRVEPPVSGSVTFSVPSSLGATLETLSRDKSSSSSITISTTEISSGKYSATAVLIAPESYPSENKPPLLHFEMRAKFTDYEGNVTTETRYLQLNIAPVVLIHGLRGKTKDTFSVNGESGIWYQLTQAGYDPSRDIHYCDYDGTRGPSDLLNRDYNVVYYALQNTFVSYRNTGIECTRADIAAHSMGGLMARKFLQEGLTHTSDSGHNWGYESYRQGMVRRVVTVATPHRGSPFAEDLISTSGMNDTARNALNSVLNYAAGMEFDTNADSAYRDLLPDSQAYGFPETVPFHSIYGDISTGLTIAVIVASINNPVGGLAAAGIRSVFDSKFPRQGHDLVVSVPSASSNFNPEYTTKFSDLSLTKYNHLNICKQDDVGKRVVELLKGSVTNFQIGGYNQPDIKPVIADMTLPYGVKGSEYSAQMTLSKGRGNITWTAKSGLPKGLKMSSAGLITGTPTKAGTSKFNVTAQNEAGKDKKKFSITVCELPAIKTKSLNAGKSDKKYKVALSASGSKPITWSAEGLPEGLTINPSKGVIEGIAESCVGDFAVTVKASNIAGTVSKNFTLTMNGVAPKIKGSLKTGKTFQSYTAKFTAAGTNPITWTLSGNLPAGLEFDSETATISGIPEESCKKRELILTASNKVKSVSKTLRLTVNATKKRAENSSRSLEHEDTGTLTPLTHNEAEIPTYTENYYEHMNFGGVALYNGWKIAAVLPVISADVSGMYDFEIELSGDVQTGEELIYIANSAEPSEDDEIAEFYDGTGMEVTNVPENRKIILSVWLRKGIIYAPVVIVKGD